jgi:predicted secreted protein
MSITAAIVTYLCVWFLCLFVALPIGIQTQGEAGSVVPGSPSSAPAVHGLKKKFIWTTAAATVIWAIIVYIVAFSPLTMQDIDVWGRL